MVNLPRSYNIGIPIINIHDIKIYYINIFKTHLNNNFLEKMVILIREKEVSMATDNISSGVKKSKYL